MPIKGKTAKAATSPELTVPKELLDQLVKGDEPERFGVDMPFAVEGRHSNERWRRR